MRDNDVVSPLESSHIFFGKIRCVVLAQWRCVPYYIAGGAHLKVGESVHDSRATRRDDHGRSTARAAARDVFAQRARHRHKWARQLRQAFQIFVGPSHLVLLPPPSYSPARRCPLLAFSLLSRNFSHWMDKVSTMAEESGVFSVEA